MNTIELIEDFGQSLEDLEQGEVIGTIHDSPWVPSPGEYICINRGSNNFYWQATQQVIWHLESPENETVSNTSTLNVYRVKVGIRRISERPNSTGYFYASPSQPHNKSNPLSI